MDKQTGPHAHIQIASLSHACFLATSLLVYLCTCLPVYLSTRILNTGSRTLNTSLLIGIVGPCGSGKSTLIAGLEQSGYRCRHIAQEHSYVPYMWQRIAHPDYLIFLDASFAVCTARRKLNWTDADFEEQGRRLAHARQHADLIIETSGLTIDEVLARALAFLSDIR